MRNHAAQESGNALIVAMLLMLVLTIVLIGFYFVSSGEQKVGASNRDNEVTYYWAVAGLEQMSNLIADYFAYTAAPTPTEITTWATNPSSFVSYPIPIGTSGLPLVTASYTLSCTAPPPPGPCATVPTFVLCSTVTGNNLGSCNGPVGGNGPLAGLEGVITPLMLTVTAEGSNNTEVKLNRVVQEVAVPIFELGVFSDTDLSFHAGANFNFGGRVHTNGNLFLAEDGGNTVNMNDHVTAAKSIIRDQLANGYTMGTYPDTSCQYSGSYCAYVNVLTATNGCPATITGLQTAPPGSCRTLQLKEGSVEQGPGSTTNPNWNTLSLTTYNGFIQDGKTGGKVLNIAIALPGINAQPIAMIQRPPAGESPTSALGMARFYNEASLRILLSDTSADIMSLPGIDSTEYPYPLAELGSTGGYPTGTGAGNYTVLRSTPIPSPYCPQNSNCTLPPLGPLQPALAESVGSSADSDYMTPAGTTSLGGYIKIEMQCAPAAPCTAWKDVTEEILAQGISRDLMTMTAEPALVSGGSLSSNKTYYYVVTALGPWGPTGGTAETLGKEYGPYTTTSTYKTITINWNPITGATGYKVYRTTTQGTYTGTGNGYIALTVGTTQTGWASPWSSYTDSGAASLTPGPLPKSQSILHLEEANPWLMAAPTLSPSSSTTASLPGNTTYYYEVTADLGSSVESAGTQANTTTGSGSKNKVTISWNAFPGAQGYYVYRTTTTDNRPSPNTSAVFTGTGNGYFHVTPGTTTSYIDSGSPAPTLSTPPRLPPDSTLNSLEAAGYPQNYFPINMYDAREGEVRDNSGPTTSSLNGIMNLMEIDVGNLQQWFAGNIATSGQYAINGPDALNNSGYILYTSDRRMNCMDGKYELEGTCASNVVTGNVPTAGESGQFGNEDIINEASTTGAPNQALDSGEDVNGNGALDYYGTYAHPIATPANVSPTGTTPAGTWNAIISAMADTTTGHPAFVRITGTQAQKNSVVIFRRALRLVNGTLGNLPPLAAAQANPCSGGTAGGFSVASENPIYVQGDYNASVANQFNDAAPKCHVPAAVMGDTVTLLSNNWTPGATLGSNTSGDANSFAYPTSPNCNNQRCANNTYYRMAVMAGKTIPFPAYNGTTKLLNWGAADTGSDGGIHNFLRYDEDWGNATLNYIGSLASFYVSQQATGIYKCCNTVYSPPTRNYFFDTDFQSISKLPPGTPRFTDVNALSYYQSVLPSQ
jgi:hypothetical protein